MAVLTQKELEDLFWKATTMTLGLEPDADEEYIQKRVRISWPQSDTGNSDWQRDENVIFLRISPAPDDYTLLKDISHVYDPERDDMKEVVEYHRCYSINLVCYGPDSAADADAIRIGILRDPIKAFLRKSKVAIIPAIREPVRLPEIDASGDWWERYDVTATFYALAVREYHEGRIALPPDNIIIKY